MADDHAYFYGSSVSRISPKGQVATPKRFRSVVPTDEGGCGFVLLPGQGKCLYMYTHKQFGVIRTNVREVALRENSAEFFRSFMEQAHPVDLDSQGRFVIPGPLRDYAEVNTDEVLFIGMDDRIELWNPQNREVERPDAQDYKKLRETNARDIFGI